MARHVDRLQWWRCRASLASSQLMIHQDQRSAIGSVSRDRGNTQANPGTPARTCRTWVAHRPIAHPDGPAGPWQATSATRISAVSGNAATFAARVILMLFSFPLRTFDTAQETRAPSGLKRRYEVSRHSRLSMGPIYLLPATSRTVSQVRGPVAAVAGSAILPPTCTRDGRVSRETI